MSRMKENKLDLSYIESEYGHYPALIWPDATLTYTQYIGEINRLARILLERGMAKNSRIALLSDISYQFPLLFFALLQTGAVIVPLDTRSPEKQLQGLIKKVKCDWLITVNKSALISKDLDIPVIAAKDLFKNNQQIQSKNILPSLYLKQEATILFTSGSGGKPKAVLHTLGNHYFSAKGSNRNISLAPGDRWLISLPFYHVAGVAICFRALLAGAACVIADNNEPLEKQIERFKITHCSLVPTQLQRMLDNKVHQENWRLLKAVLLGGSRWSPVLVKKALHMGLPLYTSYGSTEMCSQITTTAASDELRQNPKSSGKLLPYRELKVDQNGEILVNGRTLCKGYVEEDNISRHKEKDHWHRTGDCGHLDNHGSLTITGRLDNRFISGGENIYPEEIEQFLETLDDVLEACVVDILDDAFGARPVAFLKIRDISKFDEYNYRSYLENRIQKYKIPDKFYLWPVELNQLKPDRKKLRQIALRS
jgi:O-succinylbenzoic acid--CoA ligase